MSRKIKTYPDTQYFHFHNANPKNRRTGDCVIRAIALATNQSWDKVLDDLTAISHECKYDLQCPECYNIYLARLGWKRHNQPKHFDNTKFTGKEFVDYIDEEMPNTNILAHIGGHHMTVFMPYENEGSRCWDIWNPTAKCIGNYWIKEK